MSDTNNRILLVDDEVDFVEALAERLRNRDLQVDVATGGEQAITKAKAARFSVVVLDYAMPGLDGIETIKALRERDPSIPFILLSGQATIKAAVEASRLGAVDVLEKPTDIATLVDKIRQAQES